MNSLVTRRHRNVIQSLAIIAFALTGIGMAQAQSSAPAAQARISTVHTGNVINGKKVVSSLNTDDLEAGKRITLTSGVHGDEMSSVHTVQTVMSQLNAAEMSGTVMAVLDIARPAMESM